MRKQVIVDLKLLATGIGLGGLVCAALTIAPAAHVCGAVAAAGALTGLALLFVEVRSC